MERREPLSPTRKPPVFCDLCLRLAVAELDAAPLCTSCLLGEVGRDGTSTEQIEGIVPLELAAPARPHRVRRAVPTNSSDTDPDINNVA